LERNDDFLRVPLEKAAPSCSLRRASAARTTPSSCQSRLTNARAEAERANAGRAPGADDTLGHDQARGRFGHLVRRRKRLLEVVALMPVSVMKSSMPTDGGSASPRKSTRISGLDELVRGEE
jgi:hypothetical protein